VHTHTKKIRESLSPADALQILKDGNERFSGNLKANRNLLQQVNETRDGQFPFAAVLSCIDSRTSAELIYATSRERNSSLFSGILVAAPSRGPVTMSNSAISRECFANSPRPSRP